MVGQSNNRAQIDTGSRDKIVSKKLFDLFVRFKDKKFVFVEPGGNHGDSLIYKGALNLADKAGIKYQAFRHKEFLNLDIPDDSIVYMHGGGYWVHDWIEVHISKLLRAVNSSARMVILGPQTVSSDENFIKRTLALILRQRMVKDVVIFARDSKTCEVLKNTVSDYAEILQDHDTAFNLQPSDLVNYPTMGKYVFYAIRTDVEKTSLIMPSIFSYSVDPAFYCKSFDHWIYLHAFSKEIISNRLHTAIFGSIMGIPTTLLSNGYHKNRAVWEYSLKDRGVKWADGLPTGKFIQELFKYKFAKDIIMSNKIKYLKSMFYGASYNDFKKLQSALENRKD